MAWHSSTPPDGWLLCNGQEVQISSYQALYNSITLNGTVFPYGANTNGSGAAGSTHFRLPDMRDRFLMSPTKTANNPGSAYVATTGGTNTHTHDFPVATTNTTYTSTNYHEHTFNIGGLNNTGDHTHAGNEVGGLAAYNNTTSTTKTAATGNTAAAFDTHAHYISYTSYGSGTHSHNLISNYSGGGSDYAYTTGHSHLVTLTGSTQTPSSVSHAPANLRVHYIVLAVQ
jgi:microcystin-dependent protein